MPDQMTARPGERAPHSAGGAPSVALLRALDAVRNGRMVIMVDDEDRENEGDLVMAAEFMTPAAMNFMITHARGLVCLRWCLSRWSGWACP